MSAFGYPGTPPGFVPLNREPPADHAPCGCEWDHEHCPHCGAVCNQGGDGWEPAHTIRCHRKTA